MMFQPTALEVACSLVAFVALAVAVVVVLLATRDQDDQDVAI